MVEDTVRNFSESVEEDFSLSAEIEKIQNSRDVSRARAETIARTESARAYHEGQVDTWKQTKVVKGKRFLKAPGACEFCEAVNKTHGPKGTSVPIDEPMISKGQTIVGTEGGQMVVGMSSDGIVHPNCRCDIVAEII